MMKIASIFFFILSIIFLLRYVSEFLLALRDENPKPITINKVTEIFIYIAVSYIITFLITL
jgi:hypothetical protein